MVVLIAVSDLMFAPRIEAAAHALGLESVVATAPDALRDGLAAGPGLIVVDLHDAAFDPLAALRDAAAASVPALAFGRHTEPALLRTAREAGATAVARSQLVEELPDLIGSLVSAAKLDA